MSRKIGDIGTGRIVNSLVRVTISCIAMGGFAYVAGNFLDGLNKGLAWNILGLTAIIVASAAIYILSAFILKVEEIKDAVKWILRRS